jgi:hypothetical protein
MKKLEKKGNNGPLPKDDELYMQLSAIKNTLEWVHPGLVKKRGMSHQEWFDRTSRNHFILGPTFAQVYP